MASKIVTVQINNGIKLTGANFAAVLNAAGYGITVNKTADPPTGYGYVIYLDTNLGDADLAGAINSALQGYGMVADNVAVATPAATTVQPLADVTSVLPDTILGFPSTYVLLAAGVAALFLVMKEK